MEILKELTMELRHKDVEQTVIKIKAPEQRTAFRDGTVGRPER